MNTQRLKNENFAPGINEKLARKLADTNGVAKLGQYATEKGDHKDSTQVGSNVSQDHFRL